MNYYIVSYTTENGERVKNQIYTADNITHLLKDLEAWNARDIIITSSDTQTPHN